MIEDVPVYWDLDKGKLYWVSRFDTGNGEIPTRHYIDSYIR